MRACLWAQLSVLQLCLTVWPYDLYPARHLCPWDFPGKNTEMGCCFLFQGIFWTQGLNPHLLHLLHWQADSLPLCNLGSHTHIYYIRICIYIHTYKLIYFHLSPKASTTNWETLHIYPPFWNSLPSFTPSHPFRLIQSPCLSFLSHTANSR